MDNAVATHLNAQQIHFIRYLGTWKEWAYHPGNIHRHDEDALKKDGLIAKGFNVYSKKRMVRLTLAGRDVLATLPEIIDAIDFY